MSANSTSASAIMRDCSEFDTRMLVRVKAVVANSIQAAPHARQRRL